MLTERLERLAELQKKNIAPLQNLGSSAFVAFERMARKNYELMGDMVDYAVAQSRGSLEPRSPQALYERQMTEARAFAERMGARTAEYVALAEQLRADLAPDGPGVTSRAAAPTPAAERAPASDAPSADGTSPDEAATRSLDAMAVAGKKRAASKARAAGGTKKSASGKSASGKGTVGKKPTAKQGRAAKSTAGRTTAKKVVKKTAARKVAGKKTASR